MKMGWIKDVAGEFFEKLFDRIAFKRRKLYEFMLNSVDVHEIANDVMYGIGLNVDFCYLMLAYNGKKVDKVHRYKFRDIISGDHDKLQIKTMKVREYRRLPVDTQYSYILERMALDGMVGMDVNEMKDSTLKAIYIDQKLTYMRYYYVDETKDGLWYLAVGTTTGKASDFDTMPHVRKIFFALAQLKKMISNHKK